MVSRIWPLLAITALGTACDVNPGFSATDTGKQDLDGSDAVEGKIYEIVPGRGIGAVQLGGQYGHLVDAYGEPDNLVEYNRVFFATWMRLGVEVVIASKHDEPQPESIVISVGTRLPTGFSGPVVPGMTRLQADAVLGPCEDVIDDQHCYHPAGVYLGYSDGIIKTIAIHPPFTPRAMPPEMLPSKASGDGR